MDNCLKESIPEKEKYDNNVINKDDQELFNLKKNISNPEKKDLLSSTLKEKEYANKRNFKAKAKKENPGRKKDNSNQENIDINIKTNPNKESLNTIDKENLNKHNAISSLSKDSKESLSSKDNDMEKVIKNLRNSFNDMRKERLRAEKDSELQEHKLKMLQSEELKAYKKYQNEKKFKEEWENARQKTIELRKYLNETKSKRKKETEEMNRKIREMRDYIQKSLNVKKMMKFQENRLSNLQMKQKKLENSELRRSFILEESQRNRRMAESVKIKAKNYLEKKKVDDEEKKKKIVKELEGKLEEEQKKKKLFETKLNSLEELEYNLIKKLRSSEEQSVDRNDIKYRSVSTGRSSKRKKEEKNLMNSVNAK
jgi:hypothetical protein